jgi:signal transduction histidine kinase
LIILILIVFTIASFLFSRSLADRIIQPIIDLSNKVARVNVDNFNTLKISYPDDEVGSLVKVIYEQVDNLNHYLQRERWFTGDISHELRAPIMVISSSVDLLREDGISSQQRNELFRKIDDAVKSVNELINSFLLLAREKSKNTDEESDCNLGTLTRQVIENLSPYPGTKKISVVGAKNMLEDLKINVSLLSIVLTNLIKNAVFHSKEGEMTVLLEADGFRVEDSGIGLTKSVMQFINAEETTAKDRSIDYLGLGLSIVKRICEREGWGIESYDSDLGGAGIVIRFSNS